MERTKHKSKSISPSDLHAMSVVLARANLAGSLGQQYGGDRELYEALGYKTTLTYVDFATQYLRQDIAKAIIDRPVKVTWSGPLSILETDDKEESLLQKAWKELELRLKLKTKFIRLDKLTGLGSYGVLLFGFNDVKNIEGWKTPVNKKEGLELLYLKPLGQESAKINTWDKNPASERYGLPVLYDITLVDPDGNQGITQVHYSRVIHVVEDTLESEVIGTPRLEGVFNRLMDLEKLIGGSAEMFWRGARPGYAGNVDPEHTMGAAEEAGLKAQIDEFEHNLRRLFINEGVELKALATQISDPAPHVDVQIQMISAVTGIPKRILSGTERGELSSAQDAAEWTSYVQSRREEFVTPHIIRPTVDLLMEYGILPESKNGYAIEWQDLFAISEKDKVAIGKDRAEALKNYFANPLAAEVLPPRAFYTNFLGFSREQIELIEEMSDDALLDSISSLLEEPEEVEVITTEEE